MKTSLFYPLLLLSFICQAAGENPTTASTADNGKITLHADTTGHFTGSVLINNYAMPYIIDTGATVTTIPMSMATAARLPFGEQVETSTAGGRAFSKATHINNFKLGAVEINNITAHINPHLNVVLIGMNVLKYFQINQTGDTLTLDINNNLLKQSNVDSGVSVHSTNNQEKESLERQIDYISPNPITKSIVCESENKCFTRYGN